MDDLLTKARLLEGVERREVVEVKTLGGKMEIRPLTSAQWAEAQAISSEPLTMVKDRRGDYVPQAKDMRAIMMAAHKSTLYAVRMGLVEGWTDDELSGLPAGAIEELEKAILELSGVARNVKRRGKSQQEIEAMVTSFRNEAPRDGAATDEGATTGDESIDSDPSTD